MNFFVIGGTGYIGSKIVNKLVEKGHDVCCVVRNSSDLSNLPREKIQMVQNCADKIEKIFTDHRFDWVLNMACSYAQGTVLYNDVLDANIAFPLTVLNIAVKHGVYNFFSIGTGLPDSFNMYSFSKHMFSEFGRFYCEKHNINFCTIKLEMFYGGDEPKNRFIPSCIEKMKRNENVPLTVGTQRRDIIYVDDVCDAILFIIEHGVEGFQVIPVGTGEGPAVSEVMRFIHKSLGSRSELQFGIVPLRANEPDSIADMSKLHEMGFAIRYPWKEGITKMLKEEYDL